MMYGLENFIRKRVIAVLCKNIKTFYFFCKCVFDFM